MKNLLQKPGSITGRGIVFVILSETKDPSGSVFSALKVGLNGITGVKYHCYMAYGIVFTMDPSLLHSSGGRWYVVRSAH